MTILKQKKKEKNKMSESELEDMVQIYVNKEDEK